MRALLPQRSNRSPPFGGPELGKDPMPASNCNACRRPVPSDARYCPRCGVDLVAAFPVQPTSAARKSAGSCCAKSGGIATLVALVLGVWMVLFGVRLLAHQRAGHANSRSWSWSSSSSKFDRCGAAAASGDDCAAKSECVVIREPSPARKSTKSATTRQQRSGRSVSRDDSESQDSEKSWD